MLIDNLIPFWKKREELDGEGKTETVLFLFSKKDRIFISSVLEIFVGIKIAKVVGNEKRRN